MQPESEDPLGHKKLQRKNQASKTQSRAALSRVLKSQASMPLLTPKCILATPTRQARLHPSSASWQASATGAAQATRAAGRPAPTQKRNPKAATCASVDARMGSTWNDCENSSQRKAMATEATCAKTGAAPAVPLRATLRLAPAAPPASGHAPRVDHAAPPAGGYAPVPPSFFRAGQWSTQPPVRAKR
jgi:hypothetical protein